ncbi:hypothetical protein Q5424_15115 [Conexibacter sp. JD483]|uniref:hypothetical protein n=1 Tax=unclassified Conexibacter TaxID=2627773 RepID=UPI0027227B78|nr:MULTISPECIES: hypothetical protein [unclassified Conexibacter]MDO8188135.1 hypothetical protein [Conexibacter sp. CPCC 205706]MDO8201301.1 hypothetical protein [Conexibacter sp. CPCC 205762]MDR9370428.1 hypothetical protein [Conexibacter sp. JD483]
MNIGRTRAQPLALVALVLVSLLALLTTPVALLMLSPALLLLSLLYAGRTPGEELLLRWQRRVPAPRRRATRFVARGHVELPLRRIERMSASALAMRPPPLRAVCS